MTATSQTKPKPLPVSVDEKRTQVMKPEYRLYILTRTDLPSMNPGKAGAQIGHACNAFVFENPADMHPAVMEWQNQTEQGFGTTITLGCTLEQLQDIISDDESTIKGLLYDPTYPYVVDSKEILDLIYQDIHTTEPFELENGAFACARNEVTCGYYFGDANDEDFRSRIAHLKLLP